MSFTPEEQSDLVISTSFRSMVEMTAWKELERHMDSMVDDAKEELLGCLASNEVKGALATRWQQREAVVREIKNCVERWVRVPSLIAADIEESNEYTPSA